MKDGGTNLDGDGVYRRIFAGAGNSTELRFAIALAVRELRRAMEKDDNPAVTVAHIRNLDDIDPASLARAYALAEKSCIYWPAPGQIRELAGWSHADDAAAALEWVLTYIAAHGADGRPKGGAVLFGDDGAGRRVVLDTEPIVEAPQTPAQIERTLAALGNGSLKNGLLYVSQHPRVKGWDRAWDEGGGDAPTKTAERIERQWMRCYRQTLREQSPSQAVSRRKQ